MNKIYNSRNLKRLIAYRLEILGADIYNSRNLKRLIASMYKTYWCKSSCFIVIIQLKIPILLPPLFSNNTSKNLISISYKYREINKDFLLLGKKK